MWNPDGWPGDFHLLSPKVWFGIGHHKSASNLHGSPDRPWLWCVSCSHEWGVQPHIFWTRPLGPWGGAKFQLQSQFQRFLKQTLCVFSQMKDIKKYQTGFSFGRLGHAPGVALGDTVGGWRGGQKNVLRNSIRFGVCYLHNWHMQGHHFF